MKINKQELVFFTRYDSLGASSRVRLIQYKEKFIERGFKVSISPFFNNAQLKESYEQGGHSVKSIISCYIKRLKAVFSNRKKLMIIEKELFPYLPYFLERLLLKRVYIIDIDDAIHIQYKNSKWFLIRLFFSNKIKNILKNSACAFVGSNSLYKYAEECEAKKIVYVPSSVKNNSPKIYKSKEGKLKICWIGSPSTIRYLEEIRDVINNKLISANVEFLLVGAEERDFNEPFQGHIQYFKWSEETEYEIISNCDLGIMPLYDGCFENSKCAYKLIQYMSCGIPCLASAVGENLRVINNGENGFICRNTNDWISSIQNFIENPELLRKMGKNSYEKFKKSFSVDVSSDTLIDEISILSQK